MICYQFKGGTGTSSRELTKKDGGYRVGALVQANHGQRRQLVIAGVPVGREITGDNPFATEAGHSGEGSIIIVVATDAPLLPHQLKRLARRASLGVARTGGVAANGSGDIFIAFSTANPQAARETAETNSIQMIPNENLDPIFEATVQATEEAIVNAMVGAETMIGLKGRKVYALPHPRLIEVMKKYNRV